MAEGLREPAGAFFCLAVFVLFVPNGQFPEGVENKPLLLMLARRCILRSQIEWILGLFVEVSLIATDLLDFLPAAVRQFQDGGVKKPKKPKS